MTDIRRNEDALELRSGGTTLTLDKSDGKAVLQRKLLFLKMTPAEMSLSDIADVTLDIAFDGAWGIEMCNAMLV